MKRAFKTKKLLVLIILGTFLGNILPEDFRDFEIVSITDGKDTRQIIARGDFDVLLMQHGRIFLITGSVDRSRLSENGLNYRIETSLFPPPGPAPVSIQGGINGAFHSYLEVEEVLEELEAGHTDIVQKIQIGSSLENRRISAIKISDNVQIEENEPAVLFIGCHHAREWISVEVPLLLARHLARGWGSDAEISRLVRESEIWIVPLLNPDGLEYSINVYRYWRKNMRDNGNGSFGVDLNRNYGYEWGYDDSGSSPAPESGVYRGTGPFSEPETRAVRDLAFEQNFQALISYHSYGQIILYPWGFTSDPSSSEDLLLFLSQEMASRIQAVHGRQYATARAGQDFYLTNGDTTDWALGAFGIPAFTFELPPTNNLYGGFLNAESEIQIIFEENAPAALFLIDWAIQNFGNPTHVPQKQHKRLSKSPHKKK